MVCDDVWNRSLGFPEVWKLKYHGRWSGQFELCQHRRLCGVPCWESLTPPPQRINSEPAEVLIGYGKAVLVCVGLEHRAELKPGLFSCLAQRCPSLQRLQLQNVLSCHIWISSAWAWRAAWPSLASRLSRVSFQGVALGVGRSWWPCWLHVCL